MDVLLVAALVFAFTGIYAGVGKRPPHPGVVYLLVVSGAVAVAAFGCLYF